MNETADNPEAQNRIAAFLQGLRKRAGPSVVICVSISMGGDVDRLRRYAAELVSLAPDVISARRFNHEAFATGDPQRADRVPDFRDPVGAGFVESLARPGGNTTGFMSFEYSLSGKWLELLKETAPTITRVAVLRDPNRRVPEPAYSPSSKPWLRPSG